MKFFFTSRNKTMPISSFIFSNSCFSAAQRANMSLLALIVPSLDNYLVLHARCNCRLFVFIVVWCIARQADNCIKELLQFRTPYRTNLRQYSNRPKRDGAYDNAQIPNLQYSLPTSAPENCVDLAVCCNSHVQENMLSSHRFSSIQGKTISWLSEFRVSLQNFRVSFWHPKMA